jgi:hypothetical protein
MGCWKEACSNALQREELKSNKIIPCLFLKPYTLLSLRRILALASRNIARLKNTQRIDVSMRM